MPAKPNKSVRKRDWVTEKAAEVTGFSEDYVRKVRSGERNNDTVMIAVMELIEGNKKLVEEVKKVVPFNKKAKSNPRKYGDLIK